METTLTQAQSPTVPVEPDRAIPVIREYSGIKPNYCGGKPHILGHCLKVEHAAIWRERMKFDARSSDWRLYAIFATTAALVFCSTRISVPVLRICLASDGFVRLYLLRSNLSSFRRFRQRLLALKDSSVAGFDFGRDRLEV